MSKRPIPVGPLTVGYDAAWTNADFGGDHLGLFAGQHAQANLSFSFGEHG
jgi:hypothetical protein